MLYCTKPFAYQLLRMVWLIFLVLSWFFGFLFPCLNSLKKAIYIVTFDGSINCVIKLSFSELRRARGWSQLRIRKRRDRQSWRRGWRRYSFSSLLFLFYSYLFGNFSTSYFYGQHARNQVRIFLLQTNSDYSFCCSFI